MAAQLMPGKRRFTAGSVVADLGILVWFVFSLFPIVWMILLSLKSRAEQTTTYFQFSPTLSNYHTVLSEQGQAVTSVDFRGALISSLVNSGAAVLVSLVIGIPAAYAAGRWKFRGSDNLLFTMLSFRFAPELMVIVPLFVIYNQIGLFDTKLGQIWVLQLVTMPLVVWILRSYFQDLPADLEQAALLDGYTRRRAFVMVALPMVRPGIAAAALLAFVFAWNNYVFPLILTDSSATTVTVAISKFLGGGGQAYYNLTAAAAIIGALLPLILALTIQRYLVRGLSFEAVAGTLGIASLLDRFPREMSNGQRQRVALGRVMVRPADVYLLDEPLSHLDAKLRAQMRVELKQLGAMSSTTSLYVTHDYQEALALGDRIAVLRAGRVIQIGTPLAVWTGPVDTFVARSLGQPEINLIRAEVVDGQLWAADGAIALPVPPGIDLPAGGRAQLGLPGQRVTVGIRPQDCQVGLPAGAPALSGSVRAFENLLEFGQASVDVAGVESLLVLLTDARTAMRPGDTVRFAAPPPRIYLFDADSGERLR